jgi:hypothetical protein
MPVERNANLGMNYASEARPEDWPVERRVPRKDMKLTKPTPRDKIGMQPLDSCRESKTEAIPRRAKDRSFPPF